MNSLLVETLLDLADVGEVNINEVLWLIKHLKRATLNMNIM
jgi:hypothetical protein